MRSSRFALCCFAIVAVVGCEDSKRSVGDVYDDLAAALCNRIGTCCTATQISCTSGRALELADCRELVLLALRDRFFLADDAVDEGRREVDQDAAEECISRTRDLARDSICTPLPTFLPRSCHETAVFPGASEAGDPCHNNGECADGFRCSYDGPIGVCVPRQRDQESCFDHTHCSSDLYCSADGYVCRPRAVEGGPCEEDPGVAEAPLCAAGLTCNQETERCMGPGASGDPCTQSVGCQDGLWCSGIDDTCVAPQPDGEPCLSAFECASGFCDSSGGPDGVCATDTAESCLVGWGLIGVEECI